MTLIDELWNKWSKERNGDCFMDIAEYEQAALELLRLKNAKLQKLIEGYELEIKRCRANITDNDINADIYTERICTLKEVIADLKRIVESEE